MNILTFHISLKFFFLSLYTLKVYFTSTIVSIIMKTKLKVEGVRGILTHTVALSGKTRCGRKKKNILNKKKSIMKNTNNILNFKYLIFNVTFVCVVFNILLRPSSCH